MLLRDVLSELPLDELPILFNADDDREFSPPRAAALLAAVLCLPDDLLPLAVVHVSKVGNFSDDKTA